MFDGDDQDSILEKLAEKIASKREVVYVEPEDPKESKRRWTSRLGFVLGLIVYRYAIFPISDSLPEGWTWKIILGFLVFGIIMRIVLDEKIFRSFFFWFAIASIIGYVIGGIFWW